MISPNDHSFHPALTNWQLYGDKLLNNNLIAHFSSELCKEHEAFKNIANSSTIVFFPGFFLDLCDKNVSNPKIKERLP